MAKIVTFGEIMLRLSTPGVGASHCIQSGDRIGIYYIERGAVCRPSKAGASCVGMGSNLFPKEEIQLGDWESIARRCKNCLKIINDVRK